MFRPPNDQEIFVKEMDNMIRAIRTIHDPLTSNADRMLCTQIVEDFKEGPVNLKVTFAIIAMNSPILRYTGWTIAEYIIRYKWNSMPSSLREELRSGVFEAIDAYQVYEDTIECCARCVIAMMEHEWPHNWLELSSDLKERCLRGSYHSAIVFAIQRRLVENVATLTSIRSQQRRKEMHTAMSESMTQFLIIGLDMLESCELDETGALAARNIIGWLTEIYLCPNLVTSEMLLSRIVDIVIRFLSTAEKNLYEHAAHCLAMVASRKREKHENKTLVSAFFREEVLSTILTTISLTAEGSSSNEQHYRYLKSLCQLLTTLGNFLSKTWTEQLPPENFGTYMSAIVAFFNHDSLYLRYESCEVLLALSTHSIFRENADVQKSIGAVFSTMLNAFTKTGYPSQMPPTPGSRFAQMDFEDDLEWHNLFHLFLEPHKVTDIEWEAMTKFGKSVIAVAYDRKIAHTENIRMVLLREELVRKMMETTDYNVLNEMLSLHSPFMSSYKEDWDNLFIYFSLLKKAILDSADNRVVTGHAISLVLRLVQAFPTYFKEHYEHVVSLCVEVNNVITKMQKAQLLQVLALLSNIVESETLKVELLQLAAGQVIEYIRNKQWSLENVQSFITFNGFDSAPSNVFNTPPATNRAELRQALICLQGVLQQVNSTSPLASMLIAILPCFFKLARCLMELYENAHMLHPLFRDVITKILDSERQQIYCYVGENVELDGRCSAAAEMDLVNLDRQYVYDLNEQTIGIISLFVTKFPDVFYSLEQMPQMLKDLTTSLSSVPEFRARSWIKKGWKSLICCCPADYWPLLKDFFASVVGFMQALLQRMWDELYNIDFDSEPTEGQLFFEHLTCIISREYVKFLRSCYLTNDGDEKKAQPVSPLGEWLLNNNVGLYSVIMTTFAFLTFRDSALALKAISLCRALSEKLVNCYDDDVGVHMLVCSIRSLQVHGADEVICNPLIGLVFHIYLTFRPLSESLPHILLHVPDASVEKVTNFDNKVLAVISGQGVISEKQRKEMTRNLLKGVISPTSSERQEKPAHLRPLPPINRRRAVTMTSLKRGTTYAEGWLHPCPFYGFSLLVISTLIPAHFLSLFLSSLRYYFLHFVLLLKVST
ncbi:Exportin-5 [Parelaphostrongylus tenuis]|uniref:Exportin-5 n=1 Tax=Parelaphostrongylus tenuis TaxID=148309 RepID=A0AAD5RE12_PARTN|nr:Exportin-5 [Parelaphostrongylus tenuis]